MPVFWIIMWCSCFQRDIIFFIIGTKEQDQVERIFEKCGTPTEDYWPGVTNLNSYSKYAPTKVYPRTLKSYYLDNKK